MWCGACHRPLIDGGHVNCFLIKFLGDQKEWADASREYTKKITNGNPPTGKPPPASRQCRGSAEGASRSDVAVRPSKTRQFRN